MDRVYKKISGVLLSIIALAGSANSAAAEDTRPVVSPIYNEDETIDSVKDVILSGSYRGISNRSGTINEIVNVLFDGNDNALYNHSNNAYNDSIIGTIKADFVGNSNYYDDGGAIYNAAYGPYDSVIGTIIDSSFINNRAGGSGGAISNQGGIIHKITNSVFQGNYATEGYVEAYGYGAIGGAIANIRGEIELIENSSFIGNYAKSDDPDIIAAGGAIYTDNDMLISANAGNTLFKDNYVQNGSVVESNAIYAGAYGKESRYEDGKDYYDVIAPEITLSSTNGGTILIEDKIDGDAAPGSEYFKKYNSETSRYDKIYVNDDKVTYTLAIEGDSSSKVVLNNDVNNGNVTLTGTNLYLGRDNVLDGVSSFTLNSGSLYLANNSVGTMHVPVFNLAGTTNVAVDVDLAGQAMDRITADTYNVTDGAYLNVNYLNLLNDANKDKTSILFADPAYAHNVAYTGVNPVAYSPIHKYDVSYNPNDGFFTFMRGGASGGGNPSDNFNPSVLPTPVTTQAGAYTTQLQTFNYAFQHVDTFMALPYLERMAIRNQNRYALSPTGDATDVGVFSPLFTKSEYSGFWVKPYSSFENIPLKNGPKVSNINYGTLIGYDSQLQPIKHGIDRVLTGYIGYNGASQRFQGVDAYQNGGILGGTVTLYKGNFFNATTLSVGATAGTNNGMYGSEDYTMLLAGVGNKFGYNFEMLKSRLILQPSMLISYTFVNTFDYKNAAGVKINSDPLNALQLAPGIKLIGNLENGWQPYLAVNMVWNILDKTKVMADDVRLPSMSIKPYVEYGAGVQKRWAKHYTAYMQAMVRNGGRNGVSLTAGFRWAVGKK